MQVKVSVVVPVFNTESYLRRCLDSIIAQSLKDLEIVVIDDGSTDDSPKILTDYENQDPRIRIIRQPNFGLAAARNQGIEAASGAYLAFVDSDDWIHPAMLQTLYERATQEQSDIVICQFQQISDAGEILGTSSVKRLAQCSDYFKLVLASKESSMACDKLFRRELFVRNGIRFPVGLLHEDVPTIFQLFFFAQSVAVVEEPFYYWVRREGSISKTISKQHVLDFFEGFLVTKEFLEKHDAIEENWVFFVRRVIHFSLGMINRLHIDPNSQDVETLVNLIHQWMDVLGVTEKSSLEALKSYDIQAYELYMRESGDGITPHELELVATQGRVVRAEKELEAIKRTNGYRLLRRLDSSIDAMLPEGSRRRSWLRRIISIFVSSGKAA